MKTFIFWEMTVYALLAISFACYFWERFWIVATCALIQAGIACAAGIAASGPAFSASDPSLLELAWVAFGTGAISALLAAIMVWGKEDKRKGGG